MNSAKNLQEDSSIWERIVSCPLSLLLFQLPALRLPHGRHSIHLSRISRKCFITSWSVLSSQPMPWHSLIGHMQCLIVGVRQVKILLKKKKLMELLKSECLEENEKKNK